MSLNKELIYELNDFKTDSSLKRISLLHFNDVYNIESRLIEPVGGASRFATAVKQIREHDPSTIVLFSGDCFNPSMLSFIVKGRQMVDVLNELNINAACIGNHDFDFGIDHLIELTAKTNFPWLFANVFDVKTGKPLANGRLKHIIESNDIRIGIFGVVEEEWICTLSVIDYTDLIYESFVTTAKRLANEFKTIDKCDIVIALTHMRMPNDQVLAKAVPEIDLILGGHDHDYNIQNQNGKFILKSGCDFKEFSLIDLYYDVVNKRSFVQKIERVVINSSIEENETVKGIVDTYMGVLQEGLDIKLGEIKCDLDGRFVKIRTEETNLGNFMCDIILTSINADCVIINSGTFRSDAIHAKGDFKVRDLKSILPKIDTILVISCTGKQIYEALENGVSQYPKLDGRFPQVAGIKFAFDPSKTATKRIDLKSIEIQKEPIDLERTYRVATKHFLSQGKDGYDMLKSCNVLLSEEDGPPLVTLVENYFKTIDQIKAHETHRGNIISFAQRNKLIIELSKYSKSVSVDQQHKLLDGNNNTLLDVLTNEQIACIKESEEYKKMIQQYEEKLISEIPSVECRIVCLKNNNI